ncbi:hypothetical protein HC928_26040 [bacterium]|nr:hypothetical protein [bacterium]
MSSDPNQFYQERRRVNVEQKQLENAGRATLEVVELEKQAVQLPRWQQMIIYGLAVVGALALIYVAANLLF